MSAMRVKRDISSTQAARSVIDLCYAGLDPDVLGVEVLKRLQAAVPYDEPCWLTIDPTATLITGAIWDELPHWASQALSVLEPVESYNNIARLAHGRKHVGLLSEVTNSKLELSERYREVFGPLGFGDHMRAALVVDGLCWGAITLQRERSSPRFTRDEAAFMRQLTEHLAQAMRYAMLMKSTATATEGNYGGPGLIVLASDLSIVSMTPTAQFWLSEVGADAGPERKMLPHAVYTVVSRLRTPEAANGSEHQIDMPRAYLQTRNGHWLVVHAARLLPSGSGADEQTAVLVEPAQPEELAPLVVAAYGLTEREREITWLIVRGLSTGEIADRLHITMYTIQDHLKSIFYKVGVRSRRELAAQIFSRQQL